MSRNMSPLPELQQLRGNFIYHSFACSVPALGPTSFVHGDVHDIGGSTCLNGTSNKIF